jgi:CheY-like chemotaxis protein
MDRQQASSLSRFKRILIVEDDAFVRILLRTQLEDEGFTCSEAENGIEAQQQLAIFSPDLVVTDYQMPGMNGLDLIFWIQRHYSHIPVIFVSGAFPPEMNTQTATGTVAAFFDKPYSFPELHNKIEEVLEVSTSPSSYAVNSTTR